MEKYLVFCQMIEININGTCILYKQTHTHTYTQNFIVRLRLIKLENNGYLFILVSMHRLDSSGFSTVNNFDY